MNTRNTDVPVADLFINRWSSRMFEPAELSPDQIASLFEAARWAPSCFNEQPWFFLLPKDEQERETFMQLLMPANQQWVKNAALLCFAIARRYFKHNQQSNRLYAFDTGAAWISLAFQAHTMGLNAHAMAGFDYDSSYKVLGIDREKFEVMAAIAIGKPASASQDEERTQRKPPAEVYGTDIKATE